MERPTDHPAAELDALRADIAALRAEVAALRAELDTGPLAVVAERERDAQERRAAWERERDAHPDAEAAAIAREAESARLHFERQARAREQWALDLRAAIRDVLSEGELAAGAAEPEHAGERAILGRRA